MSGDARFRVVLTTGAGLGHNVAQIGPPPQPRRCTRRYLSSVRLQVLVAADECEAAAVEVRLVARDQQRRRIVRVPAAAVEV